MGDYQLVGQGSLAVMVVIWVFYLLKILESRMTEQKCVHYYISKWRSLIFIDAPYYCLCCVQNHARSSLGGFLTAAWYTVGVGAGLIWRQRLYW